VIKNENLPLPQPLNPDLDRQAQKKENEGLAKSRVSERVSTTLD
jgi:hypothetical protein